MLYEIIISTECMREGRCGGLTSEKDRPEDQTEPIACDLQVFFTMAVVNGGGGKGTGHGGGGHP